MSWRVVEMREQSRKHPSTLCSAGTRKAKRKKKKEKRKREKVCEMNNAPYSSGKVVAPNKISAR
jgi:hypothetical protein